MKSNKIRTFKLSPITASVILGMFTFIIGWCSMLVFWISYGKPADRGFTFYVSFLFGDSIFLPILAGSLLVYVKLTGVKHDNQAPSLFQKRIAWIVAIISALIGAIIQGSWLLDNQIELNWTIPNPHEFNGAGWWHAAFFVFYFAIMGYLLVRFIIARYIGRLHIETNSQKNSLYLIWFGASGYAYLRQQESLGISFVNWRLLVMIPSVVLVGLLVSTMLCKRRPVITDFKIILASSISAYGIAAVSVGL
ncbi:MAG: hypothetical protein FWG88_10020 [Oscillospiraceae bacterium]|nr:hypothetical protein [Oscillospiraceae bacterium]